MKLRTLLLTTAVTGLAAFAPSLIAASKTANVNVNATVPTVCVIDSTGDVAFGTLVGGSVATHTATGNVAYRCTIGTAATLTLSGGTSGNINARLLTGSLAGTLDYQLYTDTSGSTVFGDGTTGSGVTAVGTGMGAANQITTNIYGEILDASVDLATPDTYSDVIVATLTF